MACHICIPYTFQAWFSHSPIFPSQDWEILSYEEFDVGKNEGPVMRGRAKCKNCGEEHDFDCKFPEGYYFPQPDPWAEAMKIHAERQQQKNGE